MRTLIHLLRATSRFSSERTETSAWIEQLPDPKKYEFTQHPELTCPGSIPKAPPIPRRNDSMALLAITRTRPWWSSPIWLVEVGHDAWLTVDCAALRRAIWVRHERAASRPEDRARTSRCWCSTEGS